MRTLFSAKMENTGRQPELDTARGLAVLFMIAVHILQMFALPEKAQTAGGMIIKLLGGPPAAPIFMFILGVGLIYSRRSEPVILLKRGLLILLTGYILNFLRGTLPYLLAWLVESNTEYISGGLIELGAVDIFHFAGLALIFFSGVRKFSLRPWFVLLIAGIVSGLHYFLLPVQAVHPVWQALTGLLWGSGKTSYFPFMSWILYPAAGYVFGDLLIRCVEKKRLYSLILAIFPALTAGLFILFAVVLRKDIGLSDEYAYYHHTLLDQAVFLSFTLSWTGILFFLTRNLTGVVKDTIDRWSRNVTEIYFIHWVILGWASLFLAAQGMSWLGLSIVFLIVTVLSDGAALIYSKWRDRVK